MGLDIYAGTLTRYYSYNWKTVVQQWAEENGFGFQKITPDGEAADNEEEMPPAEVEQVADEKCQPIGHIGYYSTRRRFGSPNSGDCMRNMSTRMRLSAFQMCLP